MTVEVLAGTDFCPGGVNAQGKHRQTDINDPDFKELTAFTVKFKGVHRWVLGKILRHGERSCVAPASSPARFLNQLFSLSV